MSTYTVTTQDIRSVLQEVDMWHCGTLHYLETKFREGGNTLNFTTNPGNGVGGDWEMESILSLDDFKPDYTEEQWDINMTIMHDVEEAGTMPEDRDHPEEYNLTAEDQDGYIDELYDYICNYGGTYEEYCTDRKEDYLTEEVNYLAKLHEKELDTYEDVMVLLTDDEPTAFCYFDWYNRFTSFNDEYVLFDKQYATKTDVRKDLITLLTDNFSPEFCECFMDFINNHTLWIRYKERGVITCIEEENGFYYDITAY